MIGLNKLLDNQNGLSETEKACCNENFFSLQQAFNNYLNDIVSKNKLENLEIIIKAYQLFTYDEDNMIIKFMREKIYLSYIENIEYFISSRNDWIIYMMIDLFYCDSYLFPKKNDNNLFIEKSYPILLLDTNDLSSYIAIASFRLIAIIESENNLFYLEKYIKEISNGIYAEDVQEAIDNILYSEM